MITVKRFRFFVPQSSKHLIRLHVADERWLAAKATSFTQSSLGSCWPPESISDVSSAAQSSKKCTQPTELYEFHRKTSPEVGCVFIHAIQSQLVMVEAVQNQLRCSVVGADMEKQRYWRETRHIVSKHARSCQERRDPFENGTFN